MTTFKKLTGIIAISFFFFAGIQAQTKNEAIDAYNQSVGLMKTDVQGAISSFEKTIGICAQVGDSAADIKDKAGAVIPGLYYQLAYKNISDKNFAGAISASRATIAASEKFKNDKTKDQALSLLSQAYYFQGKNFFTTNENLKAINAFDSSLIINPDNMKVVLNKALVYRKMDNADLFGQTLDKVIAGKDTSLITQAKKQGLDYFKNQGSKSNAAKKYDAALGFLTQSAKYGEDKDVYYQMADAYNNKKNFAAGLENAQKGLALEPGAAEAKAKFYYQIAVAYAGQAKTADACENFKNASYGQFLAPSKAQMTNLKCPGAAPAPTVPAKK